MNIVLDMDGTIANLYSVEGWLPMLQSEDATPYRVASSMWDDDALANAIDAARNAGIVVSIVSWCSKGNPSREYKRETKAAKHEWLRERGINVDHLHVVAHGTDKYNVAKRDNAGTLVLIDDERGNRDNWTNKGGTAYDVHDVHDVPGTIRALTAEYLARAA